MVSIIVDSSFFISLYVYPDFVCILSLGIIPSKYVAGVVREGKFAAHLIRDDTQLVFMDEWTSDSLSCEDAKRVLQGT